MNNSYLFPTEYFAGNDVYISFNNQVIDEVVELQFALEEIKQPIHGYHSYTWEAIATGARQAIGSFKINFKETNYINHAIQRALGAREQSNDTTQSGPYAGMTDDELIAWMNGKRTQDIQYIAAEYYQKIFDLEATTLNFNDDRRFHPYFATSQGQLDIIISYGELPFFSDIEASKNNNTDILNIGTVKSIDDVKLTGFRQVISPVGDNVLEEYQFIARDIDYRLLDTI